MVHEEDHFDDSPKISVKGVDKLKLQLASIKDGDLSMSSSHKGLHSGYANYVYRYELPSI